MTERNAVRIDPSNVGQLKAWDGDQGAFWAARAERFNEGVAAYRDRFFAMAAIRPTANVLDIGCGSGQTTRDAARLASVGTALGVDLSARAIKLARELADWENLANAAFQQVDAQVHSFPPAFFDVAISRHGSMFFGDPTAAFGNIGRAIRPGGRLVLLTWQPPQRNEWMTAFRTAVTTGQEVPPPPPSAPSPSSLSDPDLVRELLTSAGFADVRLTGVCEPMYFGRDVDDASQFILGQFGWMMKDLDAQARARIVDRLWVSMAEHQTDRGVLYDSAAWLIEAHRP